MAKILFDPSGRYLLGANKGRHVSELLPGFVEWAGKNITGFTEQYQALLAGKPLKQSKPVNIKIPPQEATGRKYFISKTKRKFTP